MTYSSLSIQGNNCNEDAVFINSKFGFVIDGASGLYKEKITTAESDAQWFSNAWKEYLEKSLTDESKELSQIFRDGVKEITKGMSVGELCEKIRLVQEADSYCNKYPRFKKSDDTSVAIYSF